MAELWPITWESGKKKKPPVAIPTKIAELQTSSESHVANEPGNNQTYLIRRLISRDIIQFRLRDDLQLDSRTCRKPGKSCETGDG